MKLSNKIQQIKFTISQDFHDKTKIKKNSKEIPITEWPDSWKRVDFKGYPRFPALKLSKPTSLTVDFQSVLMKRKSTRNYSNLVLQENKLSTLLYYSAGIREKNEYMQANRFYPSPGARYPLEVYPIIFNVQGIKPGVYHYYVKSHLLEMLPTQSDFKEKVIEYFSNTDWTQNVSAFIVISGCFFRNQIKYGERGYRHVLSEMGGMMQNIYLLSSALNLGCCPTGGYMDDKFNKLLDLDGVLESTIGVIAIGIPTEK